MRRPYLSPRVAQTISAPGVIGDTSAPPPPPPPPPPGGGGGGGGDGSIEFGATSYSYDLPGMMQCAIKWHYDGYWVPRYDQWRPCRRQVYMAPQMVNHQSGWGVTYTEATTPDSVYPGGKSLRQWWNEAGDDLARYWGQFNLLELVITTWHEGNAASGWGWSWHQHAMGAWTNLTDFWTAQGNYIDTLKSRESRLQFCFGPFGVWGQYQYGPADTEYFLPPASVRDKFSFVGIDCYDKYYWGYGLNPNNWEPPTDAQVEDLFNKWWRPQLDPVRNYCATYGKGVIIGELGLSHRWPVSVSQAEGNDGPASGVDPVSGGDNAHWLQLMYDYWAAAISQGVSRVIWIYHDSDWDITSRITAEGVWGGQPRSQRFPRARAKMIQLFGQGVPGRWGE